MTKKISQKNFVYSIFINYLQNIQITLLRNKV